MAPELHRLGLLTVVDVAALAANCQSHAHWREVEEALALMAEREQKTRGLLIRTTDGSMRRNPLVKIAADAARHADPNVAIVDQPCLLLRLGVAAAGELRHGVCSE